MIPKLINNIKQQSIDSGSTNKSVSGDSHSLKSIEIDDVVDREFGNHEDSFQEKSADELKELIQNCKTKPVAFAVRTNVEYKHVEEDQCPLPEYAISFSLKEFIHIKDRFSSDWWIGRRVAIDSPLGFIPSPIKLEKIKAYNDNKIKSLGAFQIPRPRSTAEIQQTAYEATNATQCIEDDQEAIKLDQLPSSNQRTNIKEKRKMFFKKSVTMHPPYDVVPNMRPIILVGPSLKGYDVTDMMQKAVFDFLKTRYEGSITMTRVSSDISLAKRTGNGVAMASSGGKGALALMDRGVASTKQGMDNIREVYDEIERIFELARTLNLVVLDCDTINHPAQLQKTSLAPILVYLKISSPKVLQKLIKSRGKSQAKNLNVQLVIAEKLSQCPPTAFDIILDHNQLEDACASLADFLDNYWEATHPKMIEPVENIIAPEPVHQPNQFMPFPSIPSDMILSQLLMSHNDHTILHSPSSVRVIRPQWNFPMQKPFEAMVPQTQFPSHAYGNGMVLPISPAEPHSVKLFTLPPISQTPSLPRNRLRL